MKLKFIDALRGMAILGVLMVHCGQHGNNMNLPVFLKAIINDGARGVQLFFIVSAFTLFLSMTHKYEQESRPKLNFYIRRFFRIVPLYYIGICYYLFQNNYLTDFPAQISSGAIISNIFFIHSLHPLWISALVPGGWSISVEMIFYCLVPLLFAKIRDTQKAFIFILISIAISLVADYFGRTFFLTPQNSQIFSEYFFLWLPNQLSIFALGILFFFIVKNNYTITVSPVLILILSIILLIHIAGISLVHEHFISGIGFVLLGIALSKYEFKLFVNAPLVFIGKISYSLYITHFAVLFWLDKFGWVNYLNPVNSYYAVINYGIRFIILLFISMLISQITYRLVELLAQKAGRRLIKRLEK